MESGVGPEWQFGSDPSNLTRRPIMAHGVDTVDRNLLVGLAQDLIRIPSVSGNEREIVGFLHRRLVELGLETKIQEVLPGRSNLIASLQKGKGGPTVLFNGHLDTLPGPDPEHKPYEPRIQGDWLFGTGITNMKGAVAAMVTAMVALRKMETPPGRVILTAVSGECDTIGLGTRYALESGITADVAINGEPTNMRILTAHAGVTQLFIRTSGSGYHVYRKAEGCNAIEKMVNVLHGLNESILTFEPGNSFHTGLPCVNVGIINGGNVASLMAKECVAKVDVRLVSGMTPESVLSDLQNYLARLKSQDPTLQVEVSMVEKPVFMHPRPFKISEDAEIVQIVAEACRQVISQIPEIGHLYPEVYYGSDASHLLEFGIPTAICGPGNSSEISVVDEKISIEQLFQASQVYAISALQVLSKFAKR